MLQKLTNDKYKKLSKEEKKHYHKLEKQNKQYKLTKFDLV